MNKRECYIYGVLHPYNTSMLYIGKTVNIYSRIMTHRSNSSCLELRHIIAQLRLERCEPIFKTIEVCDNSVGADRERYWIEYYANEGMCNRNLNKYKTK